MSYGSDSDNTMKDFVLLCGEDLYQAAANLLYTVRTGEHAFDYLHGMSYWEYLDTRPDKAIIFHDAMETGSLPIIRQIISDYDFSNYQTIVDVGVGKGHLLENILPRVKIMIIEKEIEENQFKDMACLGDINMLVTLRGKERSLADLSELLTKTGFKLSQKIDIALFFLLSKLSQFNEQMSREISF